MRAMVNALNKALGLAAGRHSPTATNYPPYQRNEVGLVPVTQAYVTAVQERPLPAGRPGSLLSVARCSVRG
jgi:hypothetical protein